MRRLNISHLALVTLTVSACGAGGLHYWLYPEPHRPETEEATFVVHESHLLQELDGENTNLLCWGGRKTPQAYAQRDLYCRLHILPGEHTAVFLPTVNSLDRARVTFTAEAGKAYGLDRSACSALSRQQQLNCRIEVREVTSSSGGG